MPTDEKVTVANGAYHKATGVMDMDEVTGTHETQAVAQAQVVANAADLPMADGGAFVSVAGLSGLGEFSHYKGSSSADEADLDVETEDLRNAAESGLAAVKELWEIVQSIKQQVALSETYWTGAAGDKFREDLAYGLSDFAQGIEDISQYPRELVAYADEYDGVITEAMKIATSLEDIVWDEPV